MEGKAPLLAALLIVVSIGGVAPRTSRAASIDLGASTLGSASVADLSREGALGFVLLLRDGEPVVLAVDVIPPERSEPLLFSARIEDDAAGEATSLSLVLRGPVSLAEVGWVGRDSEVGMEGIAVQNDGVTISIGGPPAPTRLQLQREPEGDARWQIDTSQLAEGEGFELELQLVPEPAAPLLSLAALSCLLALRRWRAVGASKAWGLVALLAASLAPYAAVAGTTIVVTEELDGADRVGSLRHAIENLALPGDTITFATPLVTLDETLTIPSTLSGLRILGAVTISDAKLEIRADLVRIENVTFSDADVTNSQTPIGDLLLLGNTFQGSSAVTLGALSDCRVVSNRFEAEESFNDLALLLSETTGCVVSLNEFVLFEPQRLSASGDVALVIDDNKMRRQGLLETKQVSGEIRNNLLGRLEVGVPLNPAPSEAVVVQENNILRGLAVTRTNVDVVDNGITLLAFGTRDAAIVDLTNGAEGELPLGPLRFRENTVDGRLASVGGVDGVRFVERLGGVVPAEISNNQIQLDGIGILLLGPQGTVVRENTILRDGRIEPQPGILVRDAALDEVQIESNTISGMFEGIAVYSPQVGVTLTDNDIDGSDQAGIFIRAKTHVVTVRGGTSTNNATGAVVGVDSLADIEGGSFVSNSDQAGVRVEEGARARISEVSMANNRGPGIDIRPLGVTPNPETKFGNGDLDWPEPLEIDEMTGKLVGQTIPNGIVELYAVEQGERIGNPANGEGETFLGRAIADAQGRFAFPPEGSFFCVQGLRVTATATRDLSGGGGGAVAETSEFSPDLLCDDPQTDTDGDGVVDADDECPDTMPGTNADASGCNETRNRGDYVMHCGDGVCTEDAFGFFCDDCSIIDILAGVEFDCFARVSFCLTEGAKLSCDDCVARSDGHTTDCEESTCDVQSGELRCSGEPGGCVSDLGPGREGCTADTPCTLVVAPAVVSSASTPRASYRLGVQTEGGDDEFRMRGGSELDEQVASDKGEGVQELVSVVEVSGATEEVAVSLELTPTQQADGWGAGTTRTSDALGDDDTGFVSSLSTTLQLAAGDAVEVVFEAVRSQGDAGRVLAARALRPVAEGSFGLPENRRWGPFVTLAGSNGWGLFDGRSGGLPTVAGEALDFTAAAAAAALASQDGGAGAGLGGVNALGAIVIANPDGSVEDSVLVWGLGAGQLLQFVQVPSGNDGFVIRNDLLPAIADAVHLGNDPANSQVLYVGAGAPSVVTIDHFEVAPGNTQPQQGLPLADNVYVSNLVGGTRSAWAPADPDYVLVVEGGQPGALHLVARDGTAGTSAPVDSLGDNPGAVRCEPSLGLCGVTVFGSDELVLVQWAGGSQASVLGRVTVSDGPIGLAVRRENGEAVFASTGTNDDTFTITRVTADGTVVSNLTQPAPAGCGTPVDALWLRDAARNLLLSCGAPGGYAVIETGIPGP